MMDNYKQYLKSIKKEHRFGFLNNPSFEEFIEQPIKKYLFFPLAERVIDLLEWEITLKENDTIHARSKENWGIQGKISVTYLEYTKIRIFSESALDQRWDNGKNSVRVKLFIKVFHEELEKLSKEDKEEIEVEFEKEYNWDDYEIPEDLPKPLGKKKRVLVPIIGSFTTIVLLGIFAGFIDYRVIEGNNVFRLLNIPLISEAVSATIFWFILTRLCRLGNFTEIKKITWLSVTSLILFFLSTEIIFYMFLKFPWVGPVDFLIFVINYYEPFFTQQDLIPLVLNLATILIVIIMISIVFWLRIVSYISLLQVKRIPDEVFEFVEYLIVKNKSEAEIRYELSKRGWKSEQVQDEVFEAFGGYTQAVEFLKI